LPSDTVLGAGRVDCLDEAEGRNLEQNWCAAVSWNRIAEFLSGEVIFTCNPTQQYYLYYIKEEGVDYFKDRLFSDLYREEGYCLFVIGVTLHPHKVSFSGERIGHATNFLIEN
jgi:hypothetical protein